MDYISVEEAKTLSGLRLVLVKAMPSPWSLAARALFDIKSIEYTVAAQYVGQDNPELMAWSGQRNAPVVAYNDERLIHTPESIILLAERLNPGPVLVPVDPVQRAWMFGLLREIVGENSLAWFRRIAAMGLSGNADPNQGMNHKYGYRDDQFQLADQACAEILKLISKTLKDQLTRGSQFLVGNSLTALDIYAAIFLAIMVQPEDNGLIPLPEMLFKVYGQPCEAIDAAFDDNLNEYRKRILMQHVTTPMEY